jgi:hypothetical protein
MSTVRARVATASAALAACAVLSACGGGDDTAASSDAAATSSTATATADATTTAEDSGSPESRIAPDAQVAAGLTALKGVAAKVAATPDAGEAKDGLEAAWEPIEGTVKRNEPDLYLDVEDSFEQLTSADAGDVRRGRQRLDRAVAAYLARHPG